MNDSATTRGWRTVVTVALAAAAVVVIAATAIAAPGGNGKGKGKPSPSPSPSPTASATDEPPPTSTTANQADAAFVRMMIPHHHQALIMSRMAPGASSNDEVLAMAGRIDVEQTVEIGSMQNWQLGNGFDVTDPEVAYPMMMQDQMMVQMMGMATQDELDQLATLSGDAFDRLFLQLMIDHHQGAVDMVIEVDANGSDEYLRQMATDMLSTQSVQIDIMQSLLDEVG